MIVMEKIALSFADVSLVKPNISQVDYLNEEPMNVDKGIQLIDAIQKLNNNQPSAVIHNVGEKYIFSTEALRFMGSQLNTENHKILAMAIVTTNTAARLSANNFIMLYKPIVPTKLFATLTEALAWAEEIIASKK